MTSVKILKEKCLAQRNRGVLCTRQLEKLNTDTEVLSFCTRRRLAIPYVTPTFPAFRPINQYALNPYPDQPMTDARRCFSSNDPLVHRLSISSNMNGSLVQPSISRSPLHLVPQFSRSQKVDDVQQLIGKEIGKKWKALGRALQFTDGFLEELEHRHPGSLEEKIVDMIIAIQQQCKAEDELIQRMITALRKVGRNDLIQQIESL